MTREQAINYLRSSGMSDKQIDAVVSAIERTETHSCDNQYCIQNGGDICDRVHCPIGQKQTFYDDVTDEREQLDFVQKHERIPVTLDVQTHGDIISRQAAIGAVYERIRQIGYEHNPSVLSIRQAIRDLPSSQPEQRWIPVTERLPEEETDVLVTRRFLGCKDGSNGWNNHIPPQTYVEVAQYFSGEWTALSDEYKIARSRHTDPIAWMPLPEPFKGVE